MWFKEVPVRLLESSGAKAVHQRSPMSLRNRPALYLCYAPSSGGENLAMDMRAAGALGDLCFLQLENCQAT